MDLELKSKMALVTGGASGIGQATVEMLAREGARVGIADRPECGVKRAVLSACGEKHSRGATT